MIDEIQELIDSFTPANFEETSQALFFLILKNNLALSEIEEIQIYIEENL